MKTNKSANTTSAAKRQETVARLGLQDVAVKVIRNGEFITTLGRLVQRDAEAEEAGKVRVPHGVEADALFADGRADDTATKIALQRAASNGRNIFWEGGPGGAASTPDELEKFGPAEARRRAMERAAQWRALPPCAQGRGWACNLPFWIWTVPPDEYWGGPNGEHLAYEVWGSDWWYANHLESGLRDWALQVFRKYGHRPVFAEHSMFWKHEGRDIPRKYRWMIGRGEARYYVITEEDIPPEGGVHAGMIPEWIPAPPE